MSTKVALSLVVSSDQSPGVLSPHTPEGDLAAGWLLPGALKPKQTPHPKFMEPRFSPAKAASSPRVPSLLHSPTGPLLANNSTINTRDMLQWQQKDLGQENRQLANWQRSTRAVHSYHVTKTGMLNEQLTASRIQAQHLIDTQAALECQLAVLLKELDAPSPHAAHQELLAQNSQAQLEVVSRKAKRRAGSPDGPQQQAPQKPSRHEDVVTGGSARSKKAVGQLDALFHSAEELEAERQRLAEVLRMRQELEASCDELQAGHMTLRQSLLDQLRSARMQEVSGSVQLQAMRSAQAGVQAQLDSLRTVQMETSSQSLNLLRWGDEKDSTRERTQQVIAAALAEMQRKGRRPQTQQQKTRPETRQTPSRTVRGVPPLEGGAKVKAAEADLNQVAAPKLEKRSSFPHMLFDRLQARVKEGRTEAPGPGQSPPPRSSSLPATPNTNNRPQRDNMHQSVEAALPELARQAPIRQLMTLVDLSSRLTGLGRLATSLQDVLNLATTLQHRTARQDGLQAALQVLKSLASAQQVTIFGVRGSQFWNLAQDLNDQPSRHSAVFSGKQVTELEEQAQPPVGLPPGLVAASEATGSPPDPSTPHPAALKDDGIIKPDEAEQQEQQPEATPNPPAASEQPAAPDVHVPAVPSNQQPDSPSKQASSAEDRPSQSVTLVSPPAPVNPQTRLGGSVKAAFGRTSDRFKSIVSAHFMHKTPEASAVPVEVRTVKRGMVSYVVQSGTTIAVPSLKKCFAYDPAHGDPHLPPHCIMPALVLPVFRPQATGLTIQDPSAPSSTSPMVESPGASSAAAGTCCAVIQLLGKASGGQGLPTAQNSGMPSTQPLPTFTSTQVHLVGVVGAALGQALTTWDKWSAQKEMLTRRESMLAKTRRLASIQEPAALLTEIARMAATECRATTAVIYLADRARGELVGHMVTRTRTTDARSAAEVANNRMSTSGRLCTTKSTTSTSPDRRKGSRKTSMKGTPVMFSEAPLTFSPAVRFKRSNGGLLGQVISSGTPMMLSQEQASDTSLQDLPPGWGGAPAMAMVPIPAFSGAAKMMGAIQVLGCLPARGDLLAPSSLKATSSFTSHDVDMLTHLAYLTSCNCSYVVSLGTALEYHVSAGLVAPPSAGAVSGLQPLLNAGAAATASTGAAELLLGLKNLAEGAKKLGNLIRDSLQCETSRVFEVWGKPEEQASPFSPRADPSTKDDERGVKNAGRSPLGGLRTFSEEPSLGQDISADKQLALPVAPGEYHVYHIERGVAGLAAENGISYTFNGASMLLREVRSARKLVDNLRASMRVEADIAYQASSEGRSPSMALKQQNERMQAMLAAAERAAAAAVTNPLENSPGTFRRAASRVSSRSNLMRAGTSTDGRDRSRRTTFMGQDDTYHEEAPNDTYDAAVDGGGPSPWGCLAVPILQDTGEVYAVLEGVNKRRGRFNNEDVSTLMRIGKQASVVFTIAKAAEGLESCNKLVSDLSTCLASIASITSEVRIQRVPTPTVRTNTEAPHLRRLGRCISELLPSLLPGCTYIGIAIPRSLAESGSDGSAAAATQPDNQAQVPSLAPGRRGSVSVYRSTLYPYIITPPCPAQDVEEQLLQCVTKTLEIGPSTPAEEGGLQAPCEVVGSLTQVDDITGRTRPLVLRYVLPFSQQGQKADQNRVEGALVCQLNSFNSRSSKETSYILSCLVPHISRAVDAIYMEALRLGASQGDRITPRAPSVTSLAAPHALRGKAQVSEGTALSLGTDVSDSTAGPGVEVGFRVVEPGPVQG